MAEDPYRYFRIEAGELLQGMGEGVVELEKGAPTKELLGRLLRFAHTLKGAARVVKLTHAADLAHAFEDALAPYREGQRPLPREPMNDLFRLLEAMGAAVKSIDGAPPAAGGDVEAPTPAFETVRLEVGEVDSLLEGITEATVQLHELEAACVKLDDLQGLVSRLVEQLHPRRGLDGGAGSQAHLRRASALADELRGACETVGRGITSAVGRVTSELGQVRGAANRLLLVPVSSIFPGLELSARDASQSLDRPIRFSSSGGEHRLDGHVLGVVRDALLHAVRNAVAHGIEPRDVRASARKAPVGHVEILVERRGRRVAFVCKDDGRGFDVDGLRRAAVTRGVVTSAEAGALDTDALFQLILKGGLTTTRVPTSVSGRAVGLDVVRDAARRLRGEVTLQTRPGLGTTLEILVPTSLSSLTALTVVAGASIVSLPVDAIRATLRVATSEIAHSSGRSSISYEGRALPFTELASALGQTLARTKGRGHRSVVIFESGDAIAAVGVDRLLHSESIVMRPLPAHAEVDPVALGVTLDAEGNPRLVLDPDALIAAAEAPSGTVVAAEVKVIRPILVIDDSLTTRMLERSILESAGYTVELATSAEEALTKAANGSYSLFVVDVEMPGMDGFEFVTRTRRDPAFRDIPAILVTSRGETEDRQRGRDAGASAYIVKGEFDQSQLLRAIQGLIG